MKDLTPAEFEARALIAESNYLTVRLLDDFVKQSARNGYLEIRKESASFVVTVRFERKKEVKPQ